MRERERAMREVRVCNSVLSLEQFAKARLCFVFLNVMNAIMLCVNRMTICIDLCDGNALG